MRRAIGIVLLALGIIFATAYLVRAHASLREDHTRRSLPLIELIGDVPTCNDYEQFGMYVQAVYTLGSRNQAIQFVNGKFNEEVCSVVDARNLLAFEVVRTVDESTAVVRGAIKMRPGSEKYFFFTYPNAFKRRRGAD